MKRNLLPLFALLFTISLAYAGALDNKKITDGSVDNNYFVAPMPDGGYLMATRYSIVPQTVVRFNAQGQQLWAKHIDNIDGYRLNDASICNDTTAYLIYSADTFSAVNFKVIKLSADGNVLWADGFNIYTGSGGQYWGLVAKPQPNGGLIFAASIWDRMAGIALNPAGAVYSSFTIGPDTAGNAKCPGFDVAPTANGGMIIIGKFADDPAIICLNPNTTIAWTIYYNNSGYNHPRSIIPTMDGNYIIAGYYTGVISGGTVYTGGWVMKISAGGSILWKKYFTTNSGLTGGDFNQIIENSDSTFTISGLVASTTNSNSYSTITTLSSTGQLISAYTLPLNNYGLTTDYTKLYKNAAGETVLSTYEHPFGTTAVTPVMMHPAQLPDYCMVSTFQWTEIVSPLFSYLSASAFVQQTLPAPTHPDITTRDTTVTFTLSDLCVATGITAINTQQSTFSISPNPAANSVTIAIDETMVGSTATITDVTGRKIADVMLSTVNRELSTENFANGIYFISVGNATKKLIIHK